MAHYKARNFKTLTATIFTKIKKCLAYTSPVITSYEWKAARFTKSILLKYSR